MKKVPAIFTPKFVSRERSRLALSIMDGDFREQTVCERWLAPQTCCNLFVRFSDHLLADSLSHSRSRLKQQLCKRKNSSALEAEAVTTKLRRRPRRRRRQNNDTFLRTPPARRGTSSSHFASLLFLSISTRAVRSFRPKTTHTIPDTIEMVTVMMITAVLVLIVATTTKIIMMKMVTISTVLVLIG